MKKISQTKKRMVIIDIFQKCTISWFHREAGLLFFRRGIIFLLVLAGLGGLVRNMTITAYASEFTTPPDT
ncbi:MAG: hypothetical protein K2H40_11470, partial [Lachnospiraceae bacterium]|nr:hypothetical protein [Lachnospiraceae bacterium]